MYKIIVGPELKVCLDVMNGFHGYTFPKHEGLQAVDQLRHPNNGRHLILGIARIRYERPTIFGMLYALS